MSYTFVNTAMQDMNVTNETATDEQRKAALLFAFEHDLPLAWSTLHNMLSDLNENPNTRVTCELDITSDNYKQMVRMFAATVPTQILTKEFDIHMGFYSGGTFVIAKTEDILGINLKEQLNILIAQGYSSIKSNLLKQGVNNETANDEQRELALLHHCEHNLPLGWKELNTLRNNLNKGESVLKNFHPLEEPCKQLVQLFSAPAISRVLMPHLGIRSHSFLNCGGCKISLTPSGGLTSMKEQIDLQDPLLVDC